MLHPSKKEIQDWVDWKKCDFFVQENINPRLSTKKWLQMYIFTNQHEIFFSLFSNNFYKWLSILAENNTCFRNHNPTMWTPKMIKQLRKIDNTIARVVNYWIENIIGGFITKFVIDTSVSYSEDECKFFKGPWGKYLNSLKLCINMLLCEKGVLRMQSNWCSEERKP